LEASEGSWGRKDEGIIYIPGQLPTMGSIPPGFVYFFFSQYIAFGLSAVEEPVDGTRLLKLLLLGYSRPGGYPRTGCCIRQSWSGPVHTSYIL